MEQDFGDLGTAQSVLVVEQEKVEEEGRELHDGRMVLSADLAKLDKDRKAHGDKEASREAVVDVAVKRADVDRWQERLADEDPLFDRSAEYVSCYSHWSSFPGST